MGQTVIYLSDGRVPVRVDMEDVELAQLYLEEGMDPKEVTRLFEFSKDNFSGPLNIVHAAQARIRGDHHRFR